MAYNEIRTKRLYLRELRGEDAKDIFFLRSDKTINKFIDRPETKGIDGAIEFITKIKSGLKAKKLYYWGICLKENPKLIGTICLWNFSEGTKTGEIGFDLHTNFQRKGIMSEALQAILSFGFITLNLKAIEAFTHKKNQSSTKLLLKFNFELNVERFDNYNENNVIFELNKENFLL